MPLSKLRIYQKTLDAVKDLESELRSSSSLENALQNLKSAYFQKSSVKQKMLFAKKMYKQHSSVDLSLVDFYNRTLEESGKNIGDGPLWNDSGMVIDVVASLQKHFGVKTITTSHLSQLGEEIKQALISKELCAFLESKLESADSSVDETVALPDSQKQSAEGYTKKRQAIALYIFLDAFGLQPDNRANLGKLSHLLIAKPIPKKKGSTDTIAWNKSGVYNAYGDVINGKYNNDDLNFVEAVFAEIKNEDRRIHTTPFENVIKKLRARINK